MAKAPKKREKKANGIDIKKKLLSNVTNMCYQRLKFIGDCFHEPRAMGIQRLWTDLRGIDHELGMKYFLAHLTRDMDWSLSVTCYFKDAEGPEIIHAVQASAVMRNFNMQEVSENLSNVVIECINRTLDAGDEYNNESFIYYAYILMPEFLPTHFEISDNFSNLMINLDDISEFEPFGDQLPGRPSDAATLPLAIKNNGLFPKPNKLLYWEDLDIQLIDCVLHKDFKCLTTQ